MMKLYKIMFFNSMIMGTLISISAYSWFSAWIGLEINLISLIPLLKNPNNKYPSEAALKYFITQVMASSLLLFSMIIFLMMDTIFNEFKIINSILLSSSLLLKMGAAPFHFWLPEVISGLNWFNSYIILTWQKISPLLLLAYQIKIYFMLFSIIIIMSSMISGILGLNQICLRKILTYSSISHISWMISSLVNSYNISLLYFFSYCLINMNIILIFNMFNLFFLNQLSNILTYKKNIKFIFMLNFMSLGGLPPFLGFFPKWMSVNNMIENNQYFLSSMLIILTLISLYFYLRITFSTFTIYSEEQLVMKLYKMNYFHFFINLVTLSGLLWCSLMNSYF